MDDTICAISTALGVGAISIVRVSGNKSIELVNKIFKGKDLTNVDSHTINYGFIYDPETNQYVTYGDLLTWYYSQALNGVQDGKIPEDLTEIINDYFSSLFSDPTPDEPEEEQGN